MEEQIQIGFKGGAIVTGVFMQISGNFIVLTTKEINGDNLIITQRPYNLDNVEKITTIKPVERRQIPNEEQPST